MLQILSALALVASASAGAVEVTDSNYESVIHGGKNAFVKFLAPWCGHCKSMKPAWDKLGDEYAASSSVVIADADCTGPAKEACGKFGVSGYPTIKYFKDGNKDGEAYQKGRDFESLQAFVKDELEQACDVTAPAECTEKEAKFIEKMKAKSAEDVSKQLTRLQGMLSKPMKAELKGWVSQRVNILSQLASAGKTEL